MTVALSVQTVAWIWEVVTQLLGVCNTTQPSISQSWDLCNPKREEEIPGLTSDPGDKPCLLLGLLNLGLSRKC